MFVVNRDDSGKFLVFEYYDPKVEYCLWRRVFFVGSISCIGYSYVPICNGMMYIVCLCLCSLVF